MSTVFTAVDSGYFISGTTATYYPNEGDSTLNLNPIAIQAASNQFTHNWFMNFTINSPQSAAILIESDNLYGLSFTRVGDVYFLSSIKTTASGIKNNNWAYFNAVLASLRLRFTNSDVGADFTIDTAFYAGAGVNWFDNTLRNSGTLTFQVNAILDATGLVQTISPLQAFGGGGTSNELSGYGAANIQIADLEEANKTYRVTYTVNDVTNGTGTSDLKMTLFNVAGGVNHNWVKTFTVSGTQAYINGLFTNGGGDGFFIFQRNPSFVGTQTISYVQEVLTSTEPAAVVPYVQEVGTITINHQAVNPFTINYGFTYNEDEQTAEFSLGTLTDQSGQSWVSETGVNGLNYYEITVSRWDSYPVANPLVITYPSGTSFDFVTVTGSFTYMNDPASPNNNIIVKPPADWTDDIPLIVNVKRGNGTSMDLIYDGFITLPCVSTHADYSLNGSHSFVIGANSFDFGAITDLAVSKNYSVTMDFETAIAATLGSSGSGGTSTWNASGGLGFGRLTLTGTKTQVNSHLAAIDYTTTGGATLDDFVNIIYTQTQTTNSVSQGSQSVLVGSAIFWKEGNGLHESQVAFVYDQDAPVTYNLASLGVYFDEITNYTAKLIFSTPLTTANLGSVTGWTKETDYIWTKTDTRPNLNIALAAVEFVPPAQLVSDFQLDIAIYDGATLLRTTASSDLNSTMTVFLRTPVGVAWTGASLSYDQDTTTTWTNVATLSDNFYAHAGNYTIELITSVATGGSITGWTTVNSTTFSKTDTRANLQAALNSLVFVPGLTFVSNFTFTAKSYRAGLLLNTSGTKSVSIGVLYSFTNTTATLSFDQDTTTTWDLGSFSSNFDPAKTYTVELVTSVASVGAFTGWTTVNSTTFSKTGTGAALISAIDNLEFVPAVLQKSGFNLTTKLYRSAVLLTTSGAKYIAPGATYVVVGSSNSFNQDATVTWLNLYVLNSLFNNARTYTATITLSSAAGTIEGWTSINPVTYSKTTTGSSLITELSSMDFTGSIGNRNSFSTELVVFRDGVSIFSTVNTSRTISPGALYTISSSQKSFSYNITTLFTDFATVSNFNDLSTYTLVLTISGANATISGTGWSGSSVSLSTIGTGSEVASRLSEGITFNPNDYLTAPTTFTLSATKSGVTVASVTNSFVAINTPRISANGNAFEYYFISGQTVFQPLVLLQNMPEDSSLYRVRIQSTSDQLFGTVSSPGLTWSTAGGTDAVSSWATSSVLQDSLQNVSLLAKVPSTLQNTYSPPSWKYILEGNSVLFSPVVGTSLNVFNGALFNATFQLAIQKGTSSNLNFGNANPSLTFTVPYKGSNISFYEAGISYTLKIDTQGSSVTIGADWLSEGSNIYSKSGTVASLSTALQSVPVSANSTAVSRDIFIRVYQGATYLANMNWRLTTF